MELELSEIFSSRARTSVLELLYMHPSGLSLRQIVLVSGVALRSAQVALEGLAGERLLLRRTKDNRIYFLLNRKHSAFPLLKQVFQASIKARITERSKYYRARGVEVVRFSSDVIKAIGHTRFQVRS